MYHCFFHRHVCLSNLKPTPSCELLLTARKTGFRHLKNSNFQRNSYINILPNTANLKQKQIWKQENKTGFYKFCCSCCCCCLFKKKPESLSLSKGNNFGNTQKFKTEKTPISTAKPKTTDLKKNNG